MNGAAIRIIGIGEFWDIPGRDGYTGTCSRFDNTDRENRTQEKMVVPTKYAVTSGEKQNAAIHTKSQFDLSALQDVLQPSEF
jgi:hypothetical protein